jgi:hypothetical protein
MQNIRTASNGERYYIGKGYPKTEKPEGYQYLTTFRMKEDDLLYTIYITKNHSLRYSVYKSGCISAYYGTIRRIYS